MKLLAIETSTEACSCALLIGDECRERYAVAPRRHGELILTMAGELMADAEISINRLDGLAFGRGPGSFTGVRIATGVIQGIAFAADLRVAPISSLQALAQGVLRDRGEKTVLAAFDARMKQVYWGLYDADPEGVMAPRIAESVTYPEKVAVDVPQPLYGAGTGWATYGETLKNAVTGKLDGVDPACYPHARDVATLGRDAFSRGNVVGAAEALPVYLRDQVVQQKL